ncbi:hypothetical protein QQF64_015959 [Cirrhinus molitorella]|uniref:Uncharacterized protein n=1 Tax=Cirrhinus molitorella TaxID=172907 RepID=A0ABR3LLE3_9TELE
MHCNRKAAVFQQSKCQDSVGGVSSMESSDLQLKYGKPEGTFEESRNSDGTFCGMNLQIFRGIGTQARTGRWKKPEDDTVKRVDMETRR